MIVTTDTDSFAPGHKSIPKHNPPKQKPPLSKNQKIELGSFLGIAAIIITILLSPIGMDRLEWIGYFHQYLKLMSLI